MTGQAYRPPPEPAWHTWAALTTLTALAILARQVAFWIGWL